MRREELLDTLLQAAPPGRRRRRPTVGEAVDIVRCGLRARLGRPRSRGVVVYAVLVMLAGAYLGAFATHRIGWEFAPPLPSGQPAARLSATAFPGLQVWGGGDAELFVPQDDGEGIRYGSAATGSSVFLGRPVPLLLTAVGDLALAAPATAGPPS